MGEAIYQGVFEKTFKNSVAAQESGYCPSLSPWLKAILCPPQKDSFTYPMVGGRFVNLSGGQFSYNPLQQLLRLKNDTIFEKIFPQSYTATFKAEKRHIFRNFFKKASCSYTASFFGRI